MGGNRKDISALRPLAERYSEIAQLDIQQERLERYADTIGLKDVRPVVLIDEVPWGEIEDDALRNRCEHEEALALETRLRRSLYQWDCFQADMVIPPVYRVSKRIDSTGIGIDVQETLIEAETGTYAKAHEYKDQLKTDEDLEKIRMPVISYDKQGTERAAEIASEAFEGLLPVELEGTRLQYNIWDRISTYRGVDNLLLDLAIRPDFMHKTASKFRDVFAATMAQYLEQDLVETNPVILHCTPAWTRELPAADFDGTVRLEDCWGRCSAQIFAAVSPEMHDEFDLAYNQELFGECGLLYYGCCEPMDRKIDILRKRFRNLRKITVTPWADAERAAGYIGGDYVMAAKPNPAFVNMSPFRPEPVEEELRRYVEACKRHGTTCELVLKDISTIDRNPENLTRWAETAKRVLDSYY
jgi:hypothetical protein